MAAFCNISRGGYDVLYQMVYKEIIDGRYKDTKTLMLYVYNSVFKKEKNNTIQALTFAGLVPQILVTISMHDLVVKAKINLVQSAQELIDLNDGFLDDIGAVNKYLFGKGNILTREEGTALLKRLEASKDFIDMDKIMKEPNTKDFLEEPGREKDLEKYLQKWRDLKAELIKAEEKKIQDIRNAARGGVAMDKKHDREVKALEDVIEGREPEEYYDEDAIQVEELNVEDFSDKAFHTPNKAVSFLVDPSQTLNPDAEYKINSNQYDTLTNEFLLNNNMGDSSKFTLSLQNDTDDLINRRFRDETDRKKALANKGQIAMVRLPNGEQATFGNTKHITDSSHPYYYSPIVLSVNKKAFNKYIEERARIYAERFKTTYEEAMTQYHLEAAHLEAARRKLISGDAISYPISVIHQSDGVFELTDEGSIINRFRKMDGSEAFKSFRILKADEETIKGEKFKKGQILVTVEGTTKKNQLFVASAPKIRDLSGKVGEKMKNSIQFFLYHQYSTKEEAQNMIKNFFKKVLYIKKGYMQLRVVKDLERPNAFNIIYEKREIRKDGLGRFKSISQTELDSQRININERLLTTDSLTIPSRTSPMVVNTGDYYEFAKQNLVTNRRALRDTEGNFHLDKVSAYFSFALPEDLTPATRVVKSYKVEYEFKGQLHQYTVNYLNTKVYQYVENGEVLDGDQLGLVHRMEILSKLQEELKEKEPTKEELGDVSVNKEGTPIEKQPLTIEEAQLLEPVIPSLIEPEIEMLPTSIKAKEQLKEEPISQGFSFAKSTPIKTMATISLSDKTTFVINMKDEEPFKDAFNASMALKKEGLSKQRIEDINNMIETGLLPSNLLRQVVGEYYMFAVRDGDIVKVFNKNLEVVPYTMLAQTEKESKDILNKFIDDNKIKC